MKAWMRSFASEAVTQGHPDKIADQVADSILDAILAQDPDGRAGIEVLVNSNYIDVSGEIRTTARIDTSEIVKQLLRTIGYTRAELGFISNQISVITTMRQQSLEISEVVENQNSDKMGASDQGIFIGYATSETPQLMPVPVIIANDLVRQLDTVRNNNILKYLRPDGKSLVTVCYQSHKPIKIDSIVVAAQHDPEIDVTQVREDIKKHVIGQVETFGLLTDDTRIIINHLGRFVVGGPIIDTGITGRKILSDTYGGIEAVVGGVLSGKDPTKLDRTATYFARYVAKNIVAAGLASRCLVQIVYAFGVVDPISLEIECYGTEQVDKRKIIKAVKEIFDFRPSCMINTLDLKRPLYTATARYGHFGRTDCQFSWEKTDNIKSLKLLVE